MSDSSKMIDALSDGNANGSLGSLGLNSTAHGDDADEQQGAMEGTHPVVTDEPHPVGPIGSGSGNATPPCFIDKSASMFICRHS